MRRVLWTRTASSSSRSPSGSRPIALPTGIATCTRTRSMSFSESTRGYPTIERATYPREAVPGVESPRAIPVASGIRAGTISADALEAAERYARSTKVDVTCSSCIAASCSDEAYCGKAATPTRPSIRSVCTRRSSARWSASRSPTARSASVHDSIAQYQPEWSDPEHSQIRHQPTCRRCRGGIRSRCSDGGQPVLETPSAGRSARTSKKHGTLSFDVQEPPRPAFRLQRRQSNAAQDDDHRAHDGTAITPSTCPKKLWNAARQSHRARLARTTQGGLVFATTTSLIRNPARLAARRDRDARPHGRVRRSGRYCRKHGSGR